MRVLAITNLFPNPYDPIRAPFNRYQFRALAALHPLRVIAPIAWTDEWSARRKGARPLPHDRRVWCDGLEIEHPRYWYPPKVFRRAYGHCYLSSVRAAFGRAVAAFRPNVVLGSWAYPDGWAAVRLAREAGLPVAVKVHGCDVLWGLRQTPARQAKTASALCDADGVIAVSQDLADQVTKFGVTPDRISVVYNGVDSGRFCPGSQVDARAKVGLTGDGPHLLAVGSLVPVKGLDYLLAACARLLHSGLRFQCHLVGSGPLHRRLAEQTRALGLDRIVYFHGSRPHNQLPDWFRAADVFVLPSRSEGVPGVLVEAMACGTPYAASHVGGVPEVANRGFGLLTPPGDVEALAEAIARLLRQPRLRATPVQRAPDHNSSAACLAEALRHVVVRHDRSGRRPILAEV